MQTTLNYRVLNLLGGFACLLFLASAYLIEYGLNQTPCSLCLLQRYVLWIICILFLIAGGHNPKSVAGRFSYEIAVLGLSMIALLLALRQIWIQHLPKEAVPNCVADLARVLKFQPLAEAAKTILTGGGECQEANFTIFGLSLAENAAIVFLGLIIFAVLLIYLQKKRRI